MSHLHYLWISIYNTAKRRVTVARIRYQKEKNDKKEEKKSKRNKIVNVSIATTPTRFLVLEQGVMIIVNLIVI